MEDDDDDFNDDEGDALDPDDEEYLKALARMDKEAREEAEYLAGIGDDDDEEEEDDYTSAVDEVDGVSFFLQSVQGAASREPALFHDLQAQLPDNVKADLEALVAAERRRAAESQ